MSGAALDEARDAPPLSDDDRLAASIELDPGDRPRALHHAVLAARAGFDGLSTARGERAAAGEARDDEAQDEHGYGECRAQSRAEAEAEAARPLTADETSFELALEAGVRRRPALHQQALQLTIRLGG